MSPQPNGEPLSPESSTQPISSPTSWQRRESCRFREIEEVHGRAPYFRFAETNEKYQSLLKMDLLLARRLPLHDPRLTLVPMALGGAARRNAHTTACRNASACAAVALFILCFSGLGVKLDSYRVHLEKEQRERRRRRVPRQRHASKMRDGPSLFSVGSGRHQPSGDHAPSYHVGWDYLVRKKRLT